MPELNKKTLRNMFFVIAGGIVLYWLLHDTERVSVVFGAILGVFMPFLAGAGIAFVINVPMRAIESRLMGIKQMTLRRSVALLLTFLIVVLVIALVFLLLIPQLVDTVETLVPQLYDFALETEQSINGYLQENPDVKDWLLQSTSFEELDWDGLVQKGVTFIGNSISTILTGAFSAIGSVFSGVVNAFISIVFAIYCLFQKENLARQGRKLVYAFLPELWADRVVRVMRLSNTTFSNFLSGQCVEVCILGSLFAIAMAIFRMPYIPLVSVLVAVTAFIPIVGAWTGCITGTFFILVHDPMQALWFVIMFLVIQQIENNLIYPRVVGTSIGLSGMWVLVAVALGGAWLGVAGMFLMIPFASVLYTIMRELTHKMLNSRDIDAIKLAPQPPVLRSRLIPKKNKTEKKAKKQEKKK